MFCSIEETSDRRAKREVSVSDVMDTMTVTSSSPTPQTTLSSQMKGSATDASYMADTESIANGTAFDAENITNNVGTTASTTTTTSPKPSTIPPSTVYVESGATDVTIYDLEPQMEYLIEVSCLSLPSRINVDHYLTHQSFCRSLHVMLITNYVERLCVADVIQQKLPLCLTLVWMPSTVHLSLLSRFRCD